VGAPRVDNAQKPVVSLAEETGFASFRNRRRKNGFVARVATRRGLFQRRHKGVYFRLSDRPNELRKFLGPSNRNSGSNPKSGSNSNSPASQITLTTWQFPIAASPCAICAGMNAFDAQATNALSRHAPLNWRDRCRGRGRAFLAETQSLPAATSHFPLPSFVLAES
jgi:hypothetical protein